MCSYTTPCLTQPPNLSSSPDPDPGKRGDAVGSTSDHTPGKREDTISCTSDHTPGNRGDAIGSTSDHTPGKRGDTISSTSDHTLGKRGDRNQISITTCSNKFSVPEHTCGKLSGANGSVVTNAVSCHTLISGMGTIDPNLGSGSSVVIPHVEQIKTPLCKKLACLEKAAGHLRWG